MAANRIFVVLVSTVLLSLAQGCDVGSRSEATPATFAGIVALLEKHGDAVVLKGDGESRVLVSPHFQGRLFTLKVGTVESTGLVNAAAIVKGETDPQFNNFGAADRFWLGPEGGPFGLYFDPGVEFTREIWKVPAAFDKGAYKVISKDDAKVVMAQDMELVNYSKTKFKVHVDREVGAIKAAALPEDLKLSLPEGVQFSGAYSLNTMTNTGDAQWKEETGLIGIWILGQYNPSDSTVIIGPFKPGNEAELGPAFNDDYFGKLTVVSPNRFKVLENAVLFRADARRVGKFGISQQRTTGMAGSIDFGKNLLTIVKFDVPQNPERYANSTWVKEQKEPFKGDVLQSYNHGVEGKPEVLAVVPFYELESTSPVRPLKPGESIRHRHATYHFQGDMEKLKAIAKQLLGVDLQAVKDAMLK